MCPVVRTRPRKRPKKKAAEAGCCTSPKRCCSSAPPNSPRQKRRRTTIKFPAAKKKNKKQAKNAKSPCTSPCCHAPPSRGNIMEYPRLLNHFATANSPHQRGAVKPGILAGVAAPDFAHATPFENQASPSSHRGAKRAISASAPAETPP